MTLKIWEVQPQIRIINSSYDHVALYVDFQALTIELFWGRGGLAVISVPEGHDLLNYNTLDQLLFITLSYPAVGDSPSSGTGQGLLIEFRGHIRDSQVTTDNFGNVFHLIYVQHLTHVLSRYVTGYPTEQGSKSYWVGQQLAAIANDLVVWNATADGTVANGRIRDVTVIGGLEDAGAIAGTPVVNYSVEPGRNLLDVLTEIGINLGFVNVVGTEFDYVGDYALIGDLVARQVVSTDRSADVYFALELDNLANVSLISDSSREKTVAIVGGEGLGASRTFAVRTGDNYATSNDKEVFVDASTRDSSELNDLGDLVLGELKARIVLDADIFSSRGWVFNRDFFLGDYVTVYFGNVIAVKVIDSVRWVFDQGLEPTHQITLLDAS
jgi:Siphovirus ReqiPepy6 Gp37-like protein